jgi:hypothetical protein
VAALPAQMINLAWEWLDRRAAWISRVAVKWYYRPLQIVDLPWSLKTDGFPEAAAEAMSRSVHLGQATIEQVPAKS